ncbi:hypothetical protein KSP35_16180 [Aquihabitans sp. G128]|uniref:hypothetical protein n=1 Tax=Aquihabitans sp. G128 TaxID=2849779 RepID=UPI001C23EF0F|nr:hypothetical protein [Aquihabitans sp. G128]QXC59903.1 hypothetical protein KSP35_16180 [Aquihabitans sp. G128]
MELISEEELRVLSYVDTINRGGHSPIATLVAEFERGRIEARYGFPDGSPLVTMAKMLQVAMAGIHGPRTLTEAAESTIDYLIRIGALEDPGALRVTSLGRALLVGLEAVDEGSVVEVVASNDPHALVKVMGHIGSAGLGAMLADPYVGLEQALRLLTSTGVDRVLVGGGDARAKANAEMRAALDVAPIGRVFEVRVAGRELHDRCLVPRSGPVTMIGGSLNTFGKRSVVLTTVEDREGAVRRTYEDLWSKAETLVKCTPPDEVELDDAATA